MKERGEYSLYNGTYSATINEIMPFKENMDELLLIITQWKEVRKKTNTAFRISLRYNKFKHNTDELLSSRIINLTDTEWWSLSSGDVLGMEWKFGLMDTGLYRVDKQQKI